MTMTLAAIERLARDLMAQHGAGHVAFAFDNGRRRAGCVHFQRGPVYGAAAVPVKLTLSRHILPLWDEHQVRDTILHEIAHVLAGHEAGHGPAWKAQARALGIAGDRCYTTDDGRAMPASPWVGVCPANLEHTISRHRKPNGGRSTSCGKCSRTYRPDLVVTWMTRAAYEAKVAAATPAPVAAPPVPAEAPVPVAASVPTSSPSPSRTGQRGATAAEQGCLF